MDEIVAFLIDKLKSINSFGTIEEIYTPKADTRILHLVKYGGKEYEVTFGVDFVECSVIKTIPVINKKIKVDKTQYTYVDSILTLENWVLKIICLYTEV